MKTPLPLQDWFKGYATALLALANLTEELSDDQIRTDFDCINSRDLLEHLIADASHVIQGLNKQQTIELLKAYYE